jgi:acetyltransferase
MSVRNLDRIFRARRVAVIGADAGPEGRTVLRNLLSADFPGVVYPIDPQREAINGIPAFPDLASLPHAPDLSP